MRIAKPCIQAVRKLQRAGGPGEVKAA